jgi:hypothetical protein
MVAPVGPVSGLGEYMGCWYSSVYQVIGQAWGPETDIINSPSFEPREDWCSQAHTPVVVARHVDGGVKVAVK